MAYSHRRTTDDAMTRVDDGQQFSSLGRVGSRRVPSGVEWTDLACYIYGLGDLLGELT